MIDNVVSVIVPVYNKETTLENCIKSILEQTYTNLEIIIVNDGSTDHSKEICDKLTNIDNRIKVIHQANSGVSSARNLGIKSSNGTYISFVDADDEISPIFIERLINESLKNNSDVSLCCAYVLDGETKRKNSFFRKLKGIIPKERVIAQLYSNHYYKDADRYIDVGVPWGKLYKKDILIDNDILFKPKLRRMQDNVFNLEIFNKIYNIYYIDEPLYFYNLENYKNSKIKYIDDADTLFLEVAMEIHKIFLKYNDNLMYTSLGNQRIFNLFLITLRNMLCHPEYEKSFKEITKSIKELSNLYPYKQCIDNIKYKDLIHESKLITLFSRFILWSLKRKKYNLIIYSYRIYYKVIPNYSHFSKKYNSSNS